MIYPTNQHQPDGNRAAFTLQFPGLDSSPRSLVPSAPVPQPKAKRNGVTVPLASTNNSASGLTVKSCGGQEVHVDLAKDSDEENCKAPDTGSKKDPEKDKEGFDHTRLYFYPPGKGPKQAPDLTAWVCRWCPKEYALSGESYYNLKCHRDWAIIKKQICAACLGQLEAINSGGNFSRTAARIHTGKVKEHPTGAGALIAYTTRVIALAPSRRLSPPCGVRLCDPLL
ncbi:hypothetical protein PSTT_13435 [Puccinia striiformis]|uniref:Uncharacterized protein n=1 Tax=Puccinia striiformis TaxID=27350 RepID=A0A2S4URY1_9BASI|nr:hypothetical protein PSTT_13435 [Puccinia striiformis]